MNEALLVASAIADFGLVLIAFSRKRAWVYAIIVINLLLISTLGQKLVLIGGYATNVGNVYYAAVFFAIYLLLEHGARAHVFRAISIGVVSIISFTILLLLALGMTSHPETEAISSMMQSVFGNAPRFALASLAGFIVAQGVNTAMYLSAKEEPTQLHWWLRLLAVLMLAQLIDSLIFFSIAFWGSVPSDIVVESMIVGYVLKVALGALSLPLIHWSYRVKDILA